MKDLIKGLWAVSWSFGQAALVVDGEQRWVIKCDNEDLYIEIVDYIRDYSNDELLTEEDIVEVVTMLNIVYFENNEVGSC